jgi:hypothetical protein
MLALLNLRKHEVVRFKKLLGQLKELCLKGGVDPRSELLVEVQMTEAQMLAEWRKLAKKVKDEAFYFWPGEGGKNR